MGKTYRRNSSFKPRKRGKVFIKDKYWKKNKPNPSAMIADFVDPSTDIKIEIPE